MWPIIKTQVERVKKKKTVHFRVNVRGLSWFL